MRHTSNKTLPKSIGRYFQWEAATLLVVVVFATGCGSFPHNKLPPIAALPDHANVAERPSVLLNVRALTKKSGSTEPAADEKNTDEFKKTVMEITEDSNLFRRYSLDYAEPDVPDYVVEMELLHDFNNDSAAAIPLAFLQGVSEGSIFIIPFPSTIRQQLTAKVMDRYGRVLKSYKAIDGVTTWVAIWSVSFTKDELHTVVLENWQKMVKNAYQMMMNDNIFRTSTFPVEG